MVNNVTKKKKNKTQLFLDFINSRFVFKNKKLSDTHTFAFLVHSRSVVDFHRKYPITKKIPRALLEWILFHMWPITVSEVTGLISQKNGKEVRGYVIGIPMTARQMMEHREKALKKIRRSVILSRNKGLGLIGLGGLTSSLSKGGLDIMNVAKDISITTGHAYTAVNVTNNVFKLADMFKIPKTSLIAIVGASGSIGSTSAKILAQEGHTNIILIDLPRKASYFEELIKELKDLNPNINISTSHSIKDIKEASIVVTATNAPEALVTVDDVRPGMIIIDDAQPSDIHPDVLNLEDVLVVEAGVVHTKGVFSHFNFNLKNRDDNFCCMAELLILAANEHTGHYVINRATLEKVKEIKALGDSMGFKVADFQNYKEKISEKKLEKIYSILVK